jgi:heat shock protein HslJ
MGKRRASGLDFSMKRYAALPVLTAVLAFGCDESPNEPSEIIGDTWRLASLQEASATPVVPPSGAQYTLRLTADNRAEVRSDCNTCNGVYSLDESDIQIGPLACTRAFCGEDSLDTEYVQALEDAEMLDVDEGEVTLTGDAFTLRFED